MNKGFTTLYLLLLLTTAIFPATIAFQALVNPNSLVNTLLTQVLNPESAQNGSLTQEVDDTLQNPNETSIPDSTSPTPLTTTKPTTYSTSTPTPTPNPTQTTGPSVCNYNLSGPTGSVKIAVQTQTGTLTTSFYGELKAASGCKVLDDKSTDTQMTYGTLSTKEIIFNFVPPGNYTVKAYVAGLWTGVQNVSVAAGQLATVNYSVAGDAGPTVPPSEPKPTCTTPVAIPSSGSAPLTTNLYIGYTGGGSSSNLSTIEWDLTGDGSWDVTVGYGNSHQYTYQDPGNYTLKGRIKTTSGTYSDPCQTSVVVN